MAELLPAPRPLAPVVDIATRRPAIRRPLVSVAAVLVAHLVSVGGCDGGDAITFLTAGRLLRAVEDAIWMAGIDPYIPAQED